VACGKLTYRTAVEAEKARRGILRRRVAPNERKRKALEVYRCRPCGGYHLGRPVRDGWDG
jgi:hypothetical protein